MKKVLGICEKPSISVYAPRRLSRFFLCRILIQSNLKSILHNIINYFIHHYNNFFAKIVTYTAICI